MKKTILTLTGLASLFILAFCTAKKKTTASNDGPKLSFQKDIYPILESRCTPCHFPDQGKKVPLNTYEAAKSHISEMIKLVSLPKEDPHFMPFKGKKEALSDSLISVLKTWKQQGTPN